MKKINTLDEVSISAKSHKLLQIILKENPRFLKILKEATSEQEALDKVRDWVMDTLGSHPEALKYYKSEHAGRKAFEALKWSDYAAIRILDYIDNADKELLDPNLRGQVIVSNPIKLIWLAMTEGRGGAKPAFFEDMLHLFRQLDGKSLRSKPSRQEIEQWMKRTPSGLNPDIIKLRQKNRDRILNVLINKIDSSEIKSKRFMFDPGMSRAEKFQRALEWWESSAFHLGFAVRSPELLNEMLGNSIDPDTMDVLKKAKDAGIPFFANPYYLSLLNVKAPDFAIGADLAIRDYIIYSKELLFEFGHIAAWEKEDLVEPGKPNAAGWLLPSHHSVHRRYPDVAILIPDSMGRACGGLCASCQRMYDFQSGHLNFDLDALRPNESWPDKLKRLMAYFENDSQIRDILITGGDALMSSDKSLREILDAVYQMALNKRKANENRPNKEKYAELLRVRLGSRLPAYLPQRITKELADILGEFRKKAYQIGVKQFVIQTHFESSMEVTPEAKTGIDRLMEAGWTVTNQQVFSTAASRRGHTAKLRKVLNDVGVLPYYTFSVKGYMENKHAFATNARAVQEQLEEKVIGLIPQKYHDQVRQFPLKAEMLVENIDQIRKAAGIPFLATDRNVLNLPGVGKSLTYRTIGITRDGRRILEFDHDPTRKHSPIIEKMGKIVIIESKSISEYLKQLDEMGEEISEYESIFGYSLGETEPRMPVYEYPDYDFEITKEMTNLDIGD